MHYQTQTTVAVFDKHARQYQDKYMDTTLYHDTFDAFCNSIPRKDAEILEIGCGPGNITKYILDNKPDYKVTGIDISNEMLALARINNPGAEFVLMDCRNIDELAMQYDGIICGFCTPYLSKEETAKLIGDAAKLLRRGGVFYLSTMEDDYNASGVQTSNSGDELYIYYHEAGYIKQMLRESGFTLIDMQRKIYPGSDNRQTMDLVIVARI